MTKNLESLDPEVHPPSLGKKSFFFIVLAFWVIKFQIPIVLKIAEGND